MEAETIKILDEEMGFNFAPYIAPVETVEVEEEE